MVDAIIIFILQVNKLKHRTCPTVCIWWSRNSNLHNLALKPLFFTTVLVSQQKISVCVCVCLLGADSCKRKHAGHQLVQKGKGVPKPALVWVGGGDWKTMTGRRHKATRHSWLALWAERILARDFEGVPLFSSALTS